MNSSYQQFLNDSIHYMELNIPRIEKCLNMLTEEEVWRKPNKNTNSIANLLLHLCGNITQYIHFGIGEEIDNRQRALEFSTTNGYSKSELLAKITNVVNRATTIIKTTTAERLAEVKNIQGFELSGYATIIHVTEHFSYHVGQIALWTKLLKDRDLGFYADMDLDIVG